MIEPKDLVIEVGCRAYELFTGSKVAYEHIQVYPESQEYRFGVYIKHVPTGKTAYCNSEKSQIRNRTIALYELQSQIKSIN